MADGCGSSQARSRQSNIWRQPFALNSTTWRFLIPASVGTVCTQACVAPAPEPRPRSTDAPEAEPHQIATGADLDVPVVGNGGDRKLGVAWEARRP